MKRDPSIARLLLGDLLARSPLGFGPAREEMLEALFNGAPAYTQRDPRDPGIALIEALAATLDIFGFYHDRILTESKLGAAQLLPSVAQLGDIVGYTPGPALAAVARQFFEARAPGVIAGGSKLAARPTDAPGKVVFETLRALTIGPAFNRMALDPIIARQIGAMRAVLRRLATTTDELVTPLDEFPAGALTMINGLAGLELSPITGARSRAIAVGRPLRRSYGLIDTRVQCVTEYRHLRNGHPLADSNNGVIQGHDDIIAFEVSDRPILHIPDPAAAQRLRSTLELFVFDAGADPRDPGTWTAARRWEEVPDFNASEAADHHYRTVVDDRLCTYVLLRRAMGYRTLLSQDQLDRVYVRFAPAVGDIVAQKLGAAPPELTGFVVHLNDEYFRNPLVLPMVDGEPVRTLPSDWVVTDRSLELVPGRQIIIENADTGEKLIRTLGPRTQDQYLNWRHTPDPGDETVKVPDAPPRPLWDRIFNDVIDPEPGNPQSDRAHKGLFLQTFGHYFPLGMPDRKPPVHPVPPAPPEGFHTSYPVLPGHGALHAIPDGLLFVERIPEMHDAIAGWSKAASLSISPLRSAAKAGPYHLWDQFYREFENLDWALTKFDLENDVLEDLLDPFPAHDALKDAEQEYKGGWEKEIGTHGVVTTPIVPRGSTFLIVQDTALIRPGDYFLLGKRLRYCQSSEKDAQHIARAAVPAPPPQPQPPPSSAFDPHWHVAEVLQAVEVQGKIVRLKWPTQNEYDVDFISAPKPVDDPDPSDPVLLREPITELIIVPQVASVFYGERFRQELTLMPDQEQYNEYGHLAGGAKTLMPVQPRLNARLLRERTGWADLDDEPEGQESTALENAWKDMFFANIVAPPTQKIFVHPKDWIYLVRVTRDFGLGEGDLAGILVGPSDYSAFNQLVHLPALKRIENPANVIISVGADALKEAWSGPNPKPNAHWAWTNEDSFTWPGGDVTWGPNANQLKVPAIFGVPPTAELPAGTILHITQKDGEVYARVLKSDDDVLTIEMLDGAALPKEVLKITLYAVPETPTAPLARALLVLSEPPPPLQVFIAGSVVDSEAGPEAYLTGARIPRLHIESGKYYIESFLADEDYEGFMKALDGVGESHYYYFENKLDQLDKDALLDINEYNFLRNRNVEAFSVRPKADLQAGKFLLLSLAGESVHVNGMAGNLGEKIPTKWQFLTESVIFNSGNFIPVRLGKASVDHNIVANSLALTIAATGQRIGYAEDLGTIRAAIEKHEQLIEALNIFIPIPSQHLFSFNKTPEGTFTLNFLFMGDFPIDLTEGLKIYVDVIYTAEPYQPKPGEDNQPKPGEDNIANYLHEAKYTVCKDETPATWWEKRLYQFETRPLPWNPLRQLVILNTGDLKAGDYLFIDPSGLNEMHVSPCEKPALPPPSGDVDAVEALRARDHIQWTRVVEVDGRMVMVDPPVKIQPRGFYHYRVSGYRRPATAALPDPDYYKLLQSEDKPDPAGTIGPRLLSYGNRLMLRPFDDVIVYPNNHALVPIQRKWLLDNLVPGDRLLVWDERWRSAWHDHRVNGEQVEPGEPHWYDWPDRQHEVVIKRIVPRLGLVELELRMPPRFGVEYEGEVVVPDGKTTASVINFRALPFYREPFQGRRELFAVGDGDRRVKFSRFLGLVEQNFGLASVVLDKPGTLASNIEVLTLDRSAGEWQRWTEFTRIDTARAKDRAFVLGLAVPTEYPPGCEHVVGFESGTPEAPCACPDPADVQPRIARPLAAADLTSGAMALAPADTPTSEFSVSFGDGVTGQLLPNGKANVFARPVEIGRWCVHFHGPMDRRILQLGSGCLPFRIAPALASAKNLVLLVEHGAHHHWQPRAGEQRWRPSILVEIDLSFIVDEAKLSPEMLAELERELPHDKILRLREVSDAEALEGRDGVLVRPVRPGVVELFVAAKFDLASIITAADPQGEHALALHVKVFEQARTETWRLDEHFYKDILANDPTAGDGAGMVLLAETEGLAEGSLLGFNANGTTHSEVEVVEVTSVDHATYSATLTSDLTRTYDLDRSYLFGNLVEVVQGSSERQVLGSGDGSTRNLRLAVGNREPILYSSIHARAPGELAPGVVVLVDDIPWERVDSLEGRGPRDRMYCLDVEASGRCHVRFGDGQSGAIPAAGLDNIVAVVRLGDGARGNVPAGAIDKLLDGNLAVERTRNVTSGVGGKAADDVTQAREHLMTRSFTHGRAITRDDLVAAVRSLSNVVQAQLDPSADTGVVRMIIALADRQPASDDQLRALEQRIAGTMPVAAGISLELIDAVHVGIHVVLEISVNPGYFEGEVVKDLERAFAPQGDGFFALERWPLGAPLRVGDIYEHAFSLPGVATARVRWLARGVEPMELPPSTAELLRIEPGQIIRCDSDRTGDPYRARGSFRVQIKRGGR